MTSVRKSSASKPFLFHLDRFQLDGVSYVGNAPLQTACGAPTSDLDLTTNLVATVTCTDCLVTLSTTVLNRYAALMVELHARELLGDVEP